jgi:hypothetical protein
MPLSLEDLIASFASSSQEKVIRVLEYLLDEGVLKQQDGNIMPK